MSEIKATTDPAKKEEENSKLNAARAQQFEEQCFLIDHLDQLTAEGTVVAQAQGANANHYKQISQINGDSTTILNKLTQRRHISKYLDMSPLEISSMVPYFRLFKIRYNSEGQEVGTNEYIFHENVDLSDLNQMLSSGHGRPKAVGLKSFNFTHDSSNPANLKVVKAKMVIHFQNLNSFLEDAASTSWPSGLSKSKAGPKDCSKVSWMDLIRYGKGCGDSQDKDTNAPPSIERIRSAIKNNEVTPTSPYTKLYNSAQVPTVGGKTWTVQHELDFREGMKKHLPGFTRNSPYYRIKVHLGWKTTESAMSHAGGARAKELKDLADSMGYTLFLEINQHNINFKQDGSIELETDWVGSIEGAFMAPSMDIFWIDDKTLRDSMREENARAFAQLDAEVTRADAAVAAAIAKEDFEVATSAWAAAWGASDETIQAKRDAKKAADDARDRRSRHDSFKNASAQVMTIRYKAFIEEFFKVLAEGGGRLFYVDVNKEQIEITAQQHASGNASKAQARSDGNLQRQGGLKVGRSNLTTSEKLADAAAEKVGKVGTAKTEKKRETTTSAVTGQSAGKGTDSDLRVHFFLFGDLMETACRVLQSRQTQYAAESNMTVAFGPCSWLDPRSDTNNRKSLNIADIPISLNLFMRWWLETAVSPIKPKWPLRQFIADAVQQMILAAVGRDCNTSKQNIQRMTPKMSSLTFPKKGNKAAISRGSVHNVSALKNVVPKVWSPTDKLTQVLFVYAEEQNPKVTLGANEEQGILSLRLGRDKGPVKKFNFKRSQQNGMREAVIEREGENSDGELANHYSCTVDLVGSPFFVPGQITHLEPMPTIGKAAAKMLNISGYYQAVKVEGIFESGKFDTIVDAIWQTHGEPKKAGAPAPATTKPVSEKESHTTDAKKKEEAKKENKDKKDRDAEKNKTKTYGQITLDSYKPAKKWKKLDISGKYWPIEEPEPYRGIEEEQKADKAKKEAYDKTVKEGAPPADTPKSTEAKKKHDKAIKAGEAAAAKEKPKKPPRPKKADIVAKASSKEQKAQKKVTVKTAKYCVASMEHHFNPEDQTKEKAAAKFGPGVIIYKAWTVTIGGKKIKKMKPYWKYKCPEGK